MALRKIVVEGDPVLKKKSRPVEKFDARLADELSLTLTAPDFPGGGQIIYNPAEMDKIYRTGRGSFKVRARYRYDKSCNCIEITEIPPTTTTEAIIDKVVDLIKANKIREISDMRDETDLSGLKLAIDLKRGADPDAYDM